MKYVIAILILATAGFSQVSIRSIEPVAIASNIAIASWDANSESDLSHYNLTYTVDGTITTRTNIQDTVVTVDLSGKFTDKFYDNCSFYVVAVDLSGNKSAPSDTVSHVFAKEKVLKGDYNKDGQVLASDIMAMYGPLGSQVGSENYEGIADVNGDGFVLAYDLMVSRGNLGKSI